MHITPNAQAQRSMRLLVLIVAIALTGTGFCMMLTSTPQAMAKTSYTPLSSDAPAIAVPPAMHPVLPALNPVSSASSVPASELCNKWMTEAEQAPNKRITLRYDQLLAIQTKIRSLERSGYSQESIASDIAMPARSASAPVTLDQKLRTAPNWTAATF